MTGFIRNPVVVFSPLTLWIFYEATLQVDSTKLLITPLEIFNGLLRNQANLDVLEEYGLQVYGTPRIVSEQCLDNCGGISTAGWIGIGVGIALTVVIIIAVMVHCYRKRRDEWWDKAERRYSVSR